VVGVLFAACAGGRPHPNGSHPDYNTALAAGDTASAISLLERETRDESSAPEAHALLGRLHRSRGTIDARLRSQGVLEDALRRYPDDAGLLVELGATYYAQSLYGDAERVFHRVLEIDPDRCEADYYLGINAFRKWKRVQSYTDYLDAAVDHLGRAVECDPARDDAFLELALARAVLGDTVRALETCEAFRAAHPASPLPLLLSGCIAYNLRDFIACRERFDHAMSLMTPEERSTYTDVSLLLSGDDKLEYDASPLSRKAELQRLYWIAHDPDPTTEINERLLEHVCRVFMAGLRYASKTPPRPGWETSRGRALVKFGEPDGIKTTLEGTRPLDGRAEIWTYMSTDRPFVLLFRDEYLNGDYIVPIDDVASAWTLREEAPLTAHTPAAASVPGLLDAAAFRESDTATRVCLAFAVDADSLDRYLWSWDIDSFDARTAVYLSDGTPHAYLSRSIPSDSLWRDPAGEAPTRVAIEDLSLPAGSYRVACCLEDDEKVTRSIAWADVDGSRLAGSGLALSDILLCSEASVEGPVFHRRGRVVHVNPGGRYLAGEDLRLYVEVYNLMRRLGESSYELTYSIRRAEAKPGLWESIQRGVEKALLGERTGPPAISQSFQRVGTAGDAVEEIAVAIGSLEPGNYDVVISVVDNVTGEEAFVSKRFVKIGSATE
jgi:GWxTD domain-containing protein